MLPRVPGALNVLFAARLSQMAGKTGLDSQELYGVERFKAEGHTVVEVIADRKSGTVPPWKRPNLRPWVQDPALIARYDAVGALSLDRLTRGDNKSTNEIEQWAWDHGKRLITTDGLFFPCEGEDGIRWDIAKRLAHAEWLRNSERYRRMHQYLRDNGWLVGRPPFGFQIVGVGCGESPCRCRNDRKILEPSPETGPVVRDMVRLYLEGETLAGIANWLDRHGVPTSNSTTENGWSERIVRHILTSETLIGRRRHGEKRQLLRFEPLLDRAEWNELQARIKINSRRHGAVRKTQALLTGIAFCGNCGGVLHHRRTPGKNRTPYVWTGYRCDGTAKQPSTCRNMIPAAELETWVDARLASLTDVELVEERFVAGNTHEDGVADVEDQIRDLDLDAADYDERHAALRAERKRLLSLPKESDRIERVFTGKSIADHWAGLGAQDRRDWLIANGVKVHAAKVDGELQCELTAESESYATLGEPLTTGEQKDVGSAGCEAAQRLSAQAELT